MKDNIVFVGSKPSMVYAMALIQMFANQTDEVIVKARGKAISTAVDAVEISRNKFMKNISVKNITIGTDTLTTVKDTIAKVSTIEIVLCKEEPKRAFPVPKGIGKATALKAIKEASSEVKHETKRKRLSKETK